MKINDDILIYVQGLKKFFQKNKEAREYFYDFSGSEHFYDMIMKYSIENFTKNGSPKLSKEQFDGIRVKIKIKLGGNVNNILLDIPFEKLMFLN